MGVNEDLNMGMETERKGHFYFTFSLRHRGENPENNTWRRAPGDAVPQQQTCVGAESDLALSAWRGWTSGSAAGSAEAGSCG